MGEKENNNNLHESPVTRWLRNAVLGATMTDLPAMMTASGWRLNEKGDYVLDQQNDPHVKLLRDNLAAEGAGVMLGEFGIPAVYGLYNLGLRGLGKAGSNYARAKLISREINKSNTNINDVNNLFNNNFIYRNTLFGKDSGKAIHADYGDNVAGFTKGTTGASIKNNKLIPGHNPNTDTDYIWWNMDKPYSTGIKGKSFTRYIIKDEKTIPGIINIRELSKPIGLWNGKSGFVLKSERVTPEQVPLNDTSILEYNPITMVYENKIVHPGKLTSKRLIMDEKTIPAYFGKKYSVNDVVNPDGFLILNNAKRD